MHREELAAQNEELRQANSQLSRAKERAARLYDVAPASLFTLDASGLVVEANLAGAGLLGVERHELFGRSFDEVVSAPQRDTFRELRRRVAGGGTRARLETMLVTSGARHIPVLVEAAGLTSESGAAQCLLCVGDETVRRRFEDDRRALDARVAETHRLESLGVLAGGIAHDFNNILGAALTFTDLALLELPEASATRETLLEIRKANVRAAVLSKQMLAYSGRGLLEVAPLDLSEIVRSSEPRLRATVGNGITLTLELGDDLPEVDGDAVQIRDTIVELVVNAAETFGARRGSILVRTSLQPRDESGRVRVVLEVIDDGPGMDEQQRARAFDPFFSTKLAGRGLGLAVVHGTVRAHDGAVELASELGKGTCVRISLPANVATPSQPRSPRTVGARGKRVLVVDDERPLRRAAVRVLTLLGYSVDEAPDGRSAIEAVRSAVDPYAVVLLDLTMPGMDGRATLVELRKLRTDLRVIVTSAYSDLENDPAIAIQADATLPKPFGRESLEAAFLRALSR